MQAPARTEECASDQKCGIISRVSLLPYAGGSHGGCAGFGAGVCHRRRKRLSANAALLQFRLCHPCRDKPGIRYVFSKSGGRPSLVLRGNAARWCGGWYFLRNAPLQKKIKRPFRCGSRRSDGFRKKRADSVFVLPARFFFRYLPGKGSGVRPNWYGQWSVV